MFISISFCFISFQSFIPMFYSHRMLIMHCRIVILMMIHESWSMESWFKSYDVWCMRRASRVFMHDSDPWRKDPWFVIHDSRPVARGTGLVTHDLWFVIQDSWSTTRDPWLVTHDTCIITHDSWTIHYAWFVNHASWIFTIHESWCMKHGIHAYSTGHVPRSGRLSLLRGQQSCDRGMGRCRDALCLAYCDLQAWECTVV